MTQVAQGATTLLIGQFFAYPGGPGANVTGLTVSIQAPDGSFVVPQTSMGIVHSATGVYTYTWVVDSGAALGNYLVSWAANESSASEIVAVTTGAPSATIGPGAVPYCTREQVQRVLDVMPTAISNSNVDRAIYAAAPSIDGQMNRHQVGFAPLLATRTFDWLDHQYSLVWRLWLNKWNLAGQPSQVLTDGQDITSSCLFRPDAGPPYTSIEINLASSDSFSAGFTYQRAISVTGPFGYTDVENAAGSSTLSLSATGSLMTVSNGAIVGVGSLLTIDSERVLVTDRLFTVSTQTLASDMAASQSVNAVPVQDGTQFFAGEIIALDAEQMLVLDIIGNNLVVKRAWNGSVLAPHTATATVYVSRTLTVTRGLLGTTAASHSSGTTITVWAPPPLINSLAIAESVTQVLQGVSGYARSIGTDNVQQVLGLGLTDLRAQAFTAHGRKIRTRTAERFI